MPDATILFTITPLPLVSVLVWIVLGLAALYLARRPFQRAADNLGRLIYSGMRMAAASVKMTGQHLDTLNREVLIAAGIERAERQAERELERIGGMVRQSLAGYPQIERHIRADLLKLEDDYRKSAEVPPDLANWVNVIEALAAITPAGDPMAQKVLEDIHGTLKEQYKLALAGHRQAVSARHRILSRMSPRWNGMQKRLNRLGTAITQLADRASVVDRHMASLEAARCREDAVERRLCVSSVTHFFTSLLVLGGFAMGAVINFNLIALPMAEMVGGHSYVAGLKTSDLAGGSMVCLQVVLGILLLDAARMTRLFGFIGGLVNRRRMGLFWGALAMLTLLAGVESSLAFIRDRIATDMLVLKQSLAGLDPPSMAASRITTMTQMALGFILPFIIALAAIPLDSFARSSRTVLGMALVWVLKLVAFSLRLTGSVGYRTVRLMVGLYDLAIFPVIWLEGVVQDKLKTIKVRSTGLVHGQAVAPVALNMLKESMACKKSSD